MRKSNEINTHQFEAALYHGVDMESLIKSVEITVLRPTDKTHFQATGSKIDI